MRYLVSETGSVSGKETLKKITNGNTNSSELLCFKVFFCFFLFFFSYPDLSLEKFDIKRSFLKN